MNIKRTFSDIRLYCIKNRPIINAATQLLGIFQSIKDKKYVDAVRIGVDTFEKFSDKDCYPSYIFNEENGWKPLFDNEEGKISDLFINLLSPYLVNVIRLYYAVNIYNLPDDIQVLSYQMGFWDDNKTVILYNENYSDKEKIKQFLINKLFTSLNGSCIQLYKDDKKIGIIPFELREYDSKMADDLYDYVKKSMERKLPRAIMLCGEAGAGKTVVANTLLKRLNLQTLIVKDFNKVGYETVIAVIKLLNIEALLIDDFDHANIGDNSLMLGFLENVRNNLKVIIATVNSTQKFHKALVRPGRFDKIILANKLDEPVVKKLLGEDLLEYFDRIKEWPIAYINEFVLGMQLEGIKNADVIIDDLQKRVSNSTIDLILEAAKEDKKTSKEPAAKSA